MKRIGDPMTPERIDLFRGLVVAAVTAERPL